MAAIARLRLFVAVPEVYAPAARNGAKASLTLDEFPGQTFTGTLVRNANAIDPASRTLNTEVDVENPTGRHIRHTKRRIGIEISATKTSVRVLSPVDADRSRVYSGLVWRQA